MGQPNSFDEYFDGEAEANSSLIVEAGCTNSKKDANNGVGRHIDTTKVEALETPRVVEG